MVKITAFPSHSPSFVKIYYKIRTIVPAIINIAPIAIFRVNTSFKIITDRIIVSATLNLSAGATWDTLPNCKALK